MTIGLKRDGGGDDDEEKTTVRSVPDGSESDNKNIAHVGSFSHFVFVFVFVFVSNVIP